MANDDIPSVSGLVRGSFVPPEPIRQLRDLTRTRTTVTRERAREIQRLEKLLEDAGIKLSSVASDISGVLGRLMLDALIAGQRDPVALAELAKRRLRSKIPELTEALTGRFAEHHAFLAQLHLDLIDRHTHVIAELTDRIEVVIEPFRGARDLLVTIPGISTLVADVIVAETGADMVQFPTAAHLASWAGTCPGNNESAGRVKSTHTWPGDPYLKGVLGIAAMSAARSRDTYNAAAAIYAPTVGFSQKRRLITYEVNVHAPLDLATAVIPGMRERGEGWIVNVSSQGAALRPGPPFDIGPVSLEIGIYGSSKAALNRLTNALAMELYGTGIRVNTVEPRAAVMSEGAQVLVGGRVSDDKLESMEAMVEGAVALCDCEADFTGGVRVSLDLVADRSLTVQKLDAGGPFPGGIRPLDVTDA